MPKSNSPGKRNADENPLLIKPYAKYIKETKGADYEQNINKATYEDRLDYVDDLVSKIKGHATDLQTYYAQEENAANILIANTFGLEEHKILRDFNMYNVPEGSNIQDMDFYDMQDGLMTVPKGANVVPILNVVEGSLMIPKEGQPRRLPKVGQSSQGGAAVSVEVQNFDYYLVTKGYYYHCTDTGMLLLVPKGGQMDPVDEETASAYMTLPRGGA